MGKHQLHLHSMIVHVVAALAPLAAVAFIFFILRIEFLSFDQLIWKFLVWFSLIVILLVSIPAISTGIFERNHIYAKWHSTHKIKLVLSVLLVFAIMIELIVLSRSGLGTSLFSLLGLLIILANNLLVFFLGVYGLKISLGRQSFGKESYEADLFKKEPVDILINAGEQRKKEAKYLDLLTER